MGKKLARIMAISLALSGLTGCGKNAGLAEHGKNAGSEEAATATIRLSGPGLFTSVGENGTTDLVTGVQRPGYKEVINRWNEIYPDVAIEVETVPWDNWMAALQTAALSGRVDILLHGASITSAAEPLLSYLEQDPQLKEALSMTADRKNETASPYSDNVAYGLSVTANPVMVVVDAQILENYGIKIPDEGWTMEDMKEIAKNSTGIDPLTGNQTYGISMIKASNMEKNYMWASRIMDEKVFDYKDKIKNSTASFNTDEVKNTLNDLAELYPYSNPDYMEGLDLGNAYKAENDLAMILVEEPFSAYNQIKAAGLEERFMFLQLPRIQTGEYAGISSSPMGDWNMAICNTSTQKDLAWKFMKFMVTDEVVQDWIVRAYAIPANKKFGKVLTEVMPSRYCDPINSVIENYPSNYCLQANDSFNSIDFGSFSADIRTVLNEMLLGNMTADEAAAKVQKTLDEYMSAKHN